jgi:hypothetical protein
MLLWLSSRSTLVIVLVVFVLCYLVTLAVFAAASARASRGGSKHYKAVSPVTLTPLAVILGLLIAFLASHVWSSVEEAKIHVGQEAGALREALLLSEALSPESRELVRSAIRDHLRAVLEEEWPAMASGEETLRHLPVALTDAMVALLSLEPAHSGQQLARQRTLAALEQALDARRHRILLSESGLEAVQWLVVLVLSVLILATIAMVHAENRRAAAITMFIFSTAIASCLVLLLAYDRPFGGGGIDVPPTPLQEVMPG